MRKVIRKIQVFSLWFAWLVTTVHMAIPHDHHLTGTSPEKEESCPVTDGKTGHTPGFPIHCHAFNDLASEKVRPYQVSQNYQYSITFFCNSSNEFGLETNFSDIIIASFNGTIPDSYQSDLTPLRGPPSFS